MPQRTIEVSLIEEITDQSEIDRYGGSLQQTLFFPKHERQARGKVTLVQTPPTFEEKLFRALRERVFNEMPIRLLCFEQHGPHLGITLVERGVVYARLASAMQAKMHEKDHRPAYDHINWNGTAVLETDDEAIERLISAYAQYAILSHTWLRTESGEVTYGDWSKGNFDANDPGYQKLVNFGKVVWKQHGVTFGWMDTVCINKDSSSELDESIRSMYKWYHRAYFCLIYLAETEAISDMHLDPWFTRGWTLQELLAPSVIKFYNRNWKRLVVSPFNDTFYPDITQQIERATTISVDELNDIHGARISRRMQLAATRQVTREEDSAYSLMGIFDVSFSTAYGEGTQRAFYRLLQEILASTDSRVLDIFNWAGEIPLQHPFNSRLLPPSPHYYRRRESDQYLELRRPMEPLILTHLGLRVTVMLMPGKSVRSTASTYTPIGDYSATVNILPVAYHPTTYNLLDNTISGPDVERNGRFQITFAVFNVSGNATSLSLPVTCFAKGLMCSEDVGKVTDLGFVDIIETVTPIVFKLHKRTQADSNDIQWNPMYYTIKRDELAKHGMQLVSLYL